MAFSQDRSDQVLDLWSLDRTTKVTARQHAQAVPSATPASDFDTGTLTEALTSDTCCPFGSPTASVQGPLCRKRPASPALTFDSQSTVAPAGKKLCFPTTTSVSTPQPPLTALYATHTHTALASSSYASASYGEDNLYRRLPVSSISQSEQHHSSITAMDQLHIGAIPAFCSLTSAGDDDEEDVDEAESRFAAVPSSLLPNHPTHTSNDPDHTFSQASRAICGNTELLSRSAASHLREAQSLQQIIDQAPGVPVWELEAVHEVLMLKSLTNAC